MARLMFQVTIRIRGVAGGWPPHAVYRGSRETVSTSDCLHSDSLNSGDPTLLACWDADRLNLGREGITPDPHRLATDAARGSVDWAQRRGMAR
jgi:hypothetical protein